MQNISYYVNQYIKVEKKICFFTTAFSNIIKSKKKKKEKKWKITFTFYGYIFLSRFSVLENLYMKNFYNPIYTRY